MPEEKNCARPNNRSGGRDAKTSAASPKIRRQRRSDTPLGRAGEPEEGATCFVFPASDDASYMTGQVLHPNGGRVVNG